MSVHKSKFILLLFFFSGAFGLVYEVVWSRMMMNVFGSTALAVGTVLAAFMSGMAIGAWIFGKLADSSRNGLRLYAWLEIGIAALALISHMLLNELGPVTRTLFELSGSSSVLFAVIRFTLAFLLVMAPTIMMGATLPVLGRFLISRPSLAGFKLSTLYATNTFGAVSGVLITGFYLIGAYGIHVPVYLAAVGNLIIGLAALFLSSRMPQWGGQSGAAEDHAEIPEMGKTAGFVYDLRIRRIIMFGLGLSGFTSFAYEIYWTRSLVFILGNSTYALTTMLAAFLAGIALGAYLVRFLIRWVQDVSLVFGWVQVLLGLFSALALPLLFAIADPQTLNQYLIMTSKDAVQLAVAGFAVAFLLMLVPATLIGATFPLAGHIAVDLPDNTGATVGRVYAINTLGNVLGALLPGLFLLSWLGIQKGILAMAILNTGLGFTILILRLGNAQRRWLWRPALGIAVLFCALLLSRTPLQFQFPSDGELAYFQTRFYQEGPLATTKVYANPRTGEKHISVDGIVIGGTGFSEFKQLLLAHLPKLLLDRVSQELSVGVGSGMLLGESALHERVVKITGVEIEPSVVEGAEWFAEENHGVLKSEKLDIIVDDIGSFLRTRDDRYEVISADEKTADEYASNGFSYSLDYYELLSNHLAPGGLAIQWVPTTLPSSLYRMVLKTFSQGFEHVQLWYFLPAYKRGPFNTILVGSNEPLPVRADQLRRRFDAEQDAWKSLAPYGLTSAEVVLPHFVADETVIRDAVTDSPVNSLEYPRYEFYYPWDFARDRNAQVISNHEFIIDMKRKAFPEYVSGLDLDAGDNRRIRQTLAAEFRYMVGFQKFLQGVSLSEQYRIFDDALAVAPWHDSLRARIYAQYSYAAKSQRDPRERERLMQRADALYPKK